MRGWSCVLLVGCGSAPVEVDVPVRFAPGPKGVVPDEGVEITLTEARWTVSDVRLEAPPETASRPSWPVLVPAAHAHPGHDFAGDVAGELLGTWTLDLLGEPVELGTARMLDGSYATARLHLDADPTLRLAGEAVVEGSTVPFDFEGAFERDITGIAFDAQVDPDAPPSALVLAVDLAHALSFVDWRTDPGDDGALSLADGALANTLIFGAVSAPTWSLTTEE